MFKLLKKIFMKKSNEIKPIVTGSSTDNPADDILMFDKPKIAKKVIERFLKAINEEFKGSGTGLALLVFTIYNKNAGEELVIGINWTNNKFIYQ